MSNEEQEEVICPPEGLPQYMGTFADLMALLMCFFVLLLSFSEMDVQKYKQVAGSMANAFGVQNKIKAKDIPKGTSIIAQEFSPGKPQPTLITQINQQSIDIEKQTVDFTEEQEKDSEKSPDPETDEPLIDPTYMLAPESKKPTTEIEELGLKIANQMIEELESGLIEIVMQGKFLVFRIREQGSFSSGQASVKQEFKPVLHKIRDILKDTQGRITVAGHTDNQPITTAQFPSNWELSGARAATVARELLSSKELERSRFSIIGHAETIPIKENNSRANRAYNRRVEIIIVQGEQVVGSEIGLTDKNLDSAKKNKPAEGEKQ